MFQRSGYKFLIILFLLNFGYNSIAGIKITMQNKAYSPQKSIEVKTVYYLESENAKIESIATGANITMIFDRKKQTLTLIDNIQKNYNVMDKVAMKKMSNQYSDYIKRMDIEVKKLPKEQQDAYKLAKNMNKNLKYKKTGKNKKINSWSCNEYLESVGKIKTKEIWSTNLQILNLKKEDLSILDELATFLNPSSGAMGNQMGNMNNIVYNDKYGGFPVYTINFAKGQKMAESQLSSVDQFSSDKGFYTIPKDYKLMKSPESK